MTLPRRRERGWPRGAHSVLYIIRANSAGVPSRPRSACIGLLLEIRSPVSGAPSPPIGASGSSPSCVLPSFPGGDRIASWFLGPRLAGCAYWVLFLSCLSVLAWGPLLMSNWFTYGSYLDRGLGTVLPLWWEPSGSSFDILCTVSPCPRCFFARVSGLALGLCRFVLVSYLNL